MNIFIMLVGLPASGKSTYAKELSIKENALIISSDAIREELYGDMCNQDNNNEVFTEVHKRIKDNLKQNKSVIYDATNINYKKRKAFLQEIKKFDCIKECYFIATPYDLCLKQNNIRDRKVPEYIIKRMYESFYVPQYYEGFDKIKIIYNTQNIEFSIHELFNGKNGLNQINQDNPNHTLTIGKHCFKCSAICSELNDDLSYLSIAAMLHDIGKRFTRSFKNSKNETTEVAHYYNHQFVSAYDSIFYLNQSGFEQPQIMEIAQYITWHMQPYFMQTEKSKNKFIKLVGQEFYDNLMILNKADKMAK